MRFVTGLALCLMLSAASAQQLMKPLEGDYGRGYCDAVKMMMQNRDHYRALVGYAQETMEESIKRIYEKWPPRPPSGFKANETLDLEMAGIDLYVMIPPSICKDVH